MCGICGIIHFDSTQPVSDQILRRMNGIISHRGPDDEGFFLNQNVGLAMRRLSIIDLGTGHQPIFNEDGSVVIVFNGEIYNYLELRTTLEKYGHRFTTNSDTETIVHAYEQWGEACPEKLRGMFVFAIWDARKQKLFIARDRLGKKPLYYYNDGKRLIFASEIKGLLENNDVPRKLNIQGLDGYLTLGYVPAPGTLFQEIYKLPAGHHLSLVSNQLTIQPYWDLHYRNPAPQNLEECREQVRALLEESVRIRLMSDVPLGAFLSGGIDSSVVVGLMSRMMSQPVDTFSVGFEEEEHNELPYARRIAQHFGTNHHEILVNDCSPDLLQKLVWHMDEPVADPAAVPTLLVSELARQYVTVVLTGEGGDELFAGYDYYRVNRWAGRYNLLPEKLNRKVLPALARGVNAIIGRPRYHERTIWNWSLPPAARMLAWIATFTDQQKAAICTPALLQQFNHAAQTVFEKFYNACDAAEDVHRLMYTDTKVWLADDLLMKVDKMSMAKSLEARAPYLDHMLMEYVASIPASMKLQGEVSKRILKQIAEEFLPREIIYRRKHTFDVPIGKWLLGSLKELALEVIEQGIIPGVQWFDVKYLRGSLWQALEANEPGVAAQFWNLVNLGLWARIYGVSLG